MNWNDYRAAMDELPITNDFEQRACAAAKAVGERRACRSGDGALLAKRIGGNGKLPAGATAAQGKRRAPGPAFRLSTFGKTAAVVALCLVLGGTAYAAISFDDLVGIANNAGETKLAEAFSEGDGVRIDETQRVGDFDITLIGLTSGSALMNGPAYTDENRTYAVLSLALADGTPLDETYLNQADDRLTEGGVEQPDGSVLVDTSLLPRDESGFTADAFLPGNLSITPIAVDESGSIAGHAEMGVFDYAKDGVLYYLVDIPAATGGAPFNYLAVWLGAEAGSDLPGNRLTDRLVVDESGNLVFADGIAGALFELPATTV